MAIDVDGHLDTGMAQLLLDIGQRFTVLDQQRSERVSEIVKSEVLNFSSLDSLFPGFTNAVRSRPCSVGEDPFGLRTSCLGVLLDEF